MGKRELLLVLVFVVLGTVLYQATAPPAPEGGRGFSLRDMFRAARGHMGDNSATRTVTKTATLTLPDGIELVVLDDFHGRIEVIGSDAPTIDATLDVTLHGIDEADLDQQAGELALTLDATGARATVEIAHRAMGPRPDHTLRLQVPRTLGIALGGRGVANIRAVASAEFDDYRGDLNVVDVAGPITGSHREGRAEFGAGATITLETRRGTLRLMRPAAVTLDSEATDIEVMDATGPVSIDQQRCTTEVLGGTGAITVKGSGGTIKLRNVRSEVDIDAERLTVSMTMATPVRARVAIEGDDVDVTLPPGGVDVDARIERGELRVPSELTTTTEGDVRRASGSLDGGGPRIDLDVVRGSLTIRTP